MPRPPLDDLTKEHVVAALVDLDAGVDHGFGAETLYQLVHDGRRYPPKAVVGQALWRLTGQRYYPDDFSGGEGPGRANDILRRLGFDIEKKAAAYIPFGSESGLITSRGTALPETAEEMGQSIWFNMWTKALWPYRELRPETTLYWYDSQRKAIAWITKVFSVDAFEYQDKREVVERLDSVFGDDVSRDPYFQKAPAAGYCLAYKVEPVSRVHIPKADGYRFPQGGWSRYDPADVSPWDQDLDTDEIRDLTAISAELEKEGGFKDERTYRLSLIANRRGQMEFRKKLLKAYAGMCQVTGCDAEDALEAAHIDPYRGSKSNPVTNGMLLRADIHTLFDLNLLTVHPDNLAIRLHAKLMRTAYSEFQNKALRLPAKRSDAPDRDALRRRWEKFDDCADD